jgi:hypothetical protein
MSYYNNSITGNLKSGVDFFGVGFPQISISLSGDLSTSTSVKALRSITVSIDITSNLLISGTEFQYERVDININSDVSVSGTKIALAASDISITSSANISSFKTALASAEMTSDTSVTASAIEILKAASAVSGDLSTTVASKAIRKVTVSINPSLTASGVATKVIEAEVSINGMLTTVSAFKEISFLRVSINALVPNLLVNLIRFKANGVIDTSNYQTLFVIDGSPLTNQGRTFSSDLSQVIVENKNWNNEKSRYYKRSGSAGRKTFTLAWTYLPNSRQDTVDRRHARDFLKGIANDPDVHVLKMINDDSDDTTPYTETQYQVFIKDYSETLLRRDLINGVYYWDCNMTLEEV